MAEVLGLFEQAVLVAMAHLRGEGYGRTILKDVQSRLGREVAASAVYATLDRLEMKGLACSRVGDATAERGGRPRRHFTVTPAGMRALADARGATQKIWRGFVWPQKERA